MVGDYKKSKFLAEKIISSFIKKKKLRAIIVNPSTPIGQGDIKPTPTGKIILDVLGQSYDLPFSIETFEITISNITQNSALLTLNWENQITVFPFDVFTKKEVLASINKVLSSGNATTWDYHNAALYYYQNNLDKNKSKMWFDKSLSMRGGKFPFWVYAYKAQIYNRYGDKKEALKAAEKSLEMAKKTGNHHSIGMSTRALKEVQESP